jgi:hypothetical protein
MDKILEECLTDGADGKIALFPNEVSMDGG